MSVDNSSDKVRFRMMQHPQYADTQLIATYSPSRAKKDKGDREKANYLMLAKQVSNSGDL